MVEHQLRQRGIRDPRVLDVMGEVPRERFVPPEQQLFAYEDRPLPIGDDQTISQPYIVALMTEMLAPGPEDRCLEIGAGSGYQTAILARLCRQVYTIDRLESLVSKALSLIHI